MDKEIRQVTTKIELRTEGTESDPEEVIEGYALKFNRDSSVLGGWVRFIERIDEHALDNADMSNVVATFNHDNNQVLGRSNVNLDLTVDNIGLKFRVKPTDTSYAKDLMANIRSGVINQCSFAFTIPESDDAQEWRDADQDGVDYYREIRQIDKIYDVSVVTTPAYPDTEATVGQRSLDMLKKKQTEKESRELEPLREKMLLELEREQLLRDL